MPPLPTPVPVLKKCVVASGNPNLRLHLFLQGSYILSVYLSVLCVHACGGLINVYYLLQYLSILVLRQPLTELGAHQSG